MIITFLHLVKRPLSGPILLNNSPKYLRFVSPGTIDGFRLHPLDALDLPDDFAQESEAIYPAVKVDEARIHIKRDDPPVSEWRQIATYELVWPIPPDELVRDNVKWKEWVEQQEAKHGS